MIAPKLVVVGHCTSTTARILCCADRQVSGPRRVARLAWRAADRTGCSDVTLAAAPPYETGVFDLTGLPEASVLDYVILVGDEGASLPDAAELLQSATPRRVRLLPARRPPRVALVSCNGAFEVAEPERRYALWRVLREQIEAGNVDLIIHAGDQVYADALVVAPGRFAPRPMTTRRISTWSGSTGACMSRTPGARRRSPRCWRRARQ